MRSRIPDSKLKKSEELKKQTEEFIKNGGKVTEIKDSIDPNTKPDRRVRGQD